MRDQAESLRALLRAREDPGVPARPPSRPSARVITICSGKGGVGKTSVTLNLAYAMMQRGARVLLMDADLGMANVEVLLGMGCPHNLQHVTRGLKQLRDVVVEGPKGLRWISGGSGIAEMADLSPGQLNGLVASFGELDSATDYLLIDTAAGISRSVLSFVRAADEAIVICTPEPTSMTDAYGLIKSVSGQPCEGSISLLMNRVSGEREAMDVGHGVQSAARQFLHTEIGVLGFLPEDPVVARAVRMQEPFFLSQPSARISRAIDQVAAKLVHQETPARAGGLGAFVQRLAGFWNP